MTITKRVWAGQDSNKEAWILDLIIQGKRRRRIFKTLEEAETVAQSFKLFSCSFKTSIRKSAT